MKQRIKTVIIILLIAAGIPKNTPAGDTVKFAIGEWPPYTSKVDTGSKTLEKIVTEAFRLEGVEVKYDYFPWKRSYIYTVEGTYDATFPWVKSNERNSLFYISSEPLLIEESVFFYVKGKDFDWTTLDDLKKYKVGVTIGYVQEEILRKRGISAEACPNEYLNFRKLYAGRIDVYWTTRNVGYAAIRKIYGNRGTELFTHHPRSAGVLKHYVFFSKKNSYGRKLRNKFDSGLKELKASGVYDRILSGK